MTSLVVKLSDRGRRKCQRNAVASVASQSHVVLPVASIVESLIVGARQMPANIPLREFSRALHEVCVSSLPSVTVHAPVVSRTINASGINRLIPRKYRHDPLVTERRASRHLARRLTFSNGSRVFSVAFCEEFQETRRRSDRTTRECLLVRRSKRLPRRPFADYWTRWKIATVTASPFGASKGNQREPKGTKGHVRKVKNR